MSEANMSSAESTSKVMLQEQLKKLNEAGLLACLDEWFGYKPDRPMSKDEMAEKIIILQKEKIANVDKANKESAEAMAGDDDPIVRVKFQNLESPGTPLEFTYAGPKGFKTKVVNGNTVVEPARKFTMYHNEETNVPMSVVDHLNNLQVPENKFDVDEHGFVRGVNNGMRNRFACQLILTADQRRKLGMKA